MEAAVSHTCHRQIDLLVVSITVGKIVDRNDSNSAIKQMTSTCLVEFVHSTFDLLQQSHLMEEIEAIWFASEPSLKGHS